MRPIIISSLFENTATYRAVVKVAQTLGIHLRELPAGGTPAPRSFLLISGSCGQEPLCSSGTRFHRLESAARWARDQIPIRNFFLCLTGPLGTPATHSLEKLGLIAVPDIPALVLAASRIPRELTVHEVAAIREPLLYSRIRFVLHELRSSRGLTEGTLGTARNVLVEAIDAGLTHSGTPPEDWSPQTMERTLSTVLRGGRHA